MFQLQRPWVNLDAVAALWIARWSRVGAVVVLVAVWVVDAATSLSLTFHFTTPVDFVRSLRFGHTLNWADYVGGTALLLGAVFVAVAGSSVLRFWRSVRLPALLAAAAFWLSLDLANGTSFIWPRNATIVRSNPSGSGLGTLGVQWANWKDFGHISPYPDPLPAQHLDALTNWAESHPDGRIMVVVVESLGAHHDEATRAWLDRRLLDGIGSRGRIEHGLLSSRGATTAGELRTLCALAGAYYRVTTDATAGCLPRQLQRVGWSGTALHGFTGRMFNRRAWWPVLGFEHVLFGENLQTPAASTCGLAFRGACDLDVLRRAARVLQMPRSLAYVLTLNTHLPSAPIAPESALAALCAAQRSDEEVCGFVQSLGQVLFSVRQVAQGLPDDTALLVVGDHPPPFARPAQRSQFLDSKVPYYLVLP